MFTREEKDQIQKNLTAVKNYCTMEIATKLRKGDKVVVEFGPEEATATGWGKEPRYSLCVTEDCDVSFRVGGLWIDFSDASSPNFYEKKWTYAAELLPVWQEAKARLHTAIKKRDEDIRLMTVGFYI